MAGNRVTSRQVAERAGVSRTTVSFVLNNTAQHKIGEATRQRVLQAARELGYTPNASARALVSGKAATIGLVVNNSEHLRVDAFVMQALNSLSRVCAAHHYRLLIETSEGDPAPFDYHRLVEENRIDGLVVINPDPRDARLSELIEREYPMVLLGNHPDPRVASVSVHSFDAMREATAHMIGLQHRHIGFIHYRQLTGLDGGGRFGGYRAALADAGISFERELVRSGDYDAESGFAAMQSLLAIPAPPTAVMTGNDTIAIGAIAAIRDAGFEVPGDIAVVGFDDIPIAPFAVPALTTIRVPAAEMAHRAGEMVIRLIGGEPLAQRRTWLPTELVIRQSSGNQVQSSPEPGEAHIQLG